MTDTKHTPGPWKAALQYGQWYVRQDPTNWNGGGYQHVCALPAGPKGGHYGDMFAANARLIAAAPELLTALQDVLRDWHDGSVIEVYRGKPGGIDVATTRIARARAAIAKATGSAS